MNINPTSMRDLFGGFKVSFNKGLKNTASYYDKVAMTVTSNSADETYTWLKDMPRIREWLGERQIHDLSAGRFKIVNKKFELTVSIPRTAIEDDKYGIYGPMIEKIGADTAKHPDEMVFSVLKSGFAETCSDGQYFFDTDHEGFRSW